MSFGYSIGDFIKLIELANELRHRFVDAPNQFQAISIEYDSTTVASPIKVYVLMILQGSKPNNCSRRCEGLVTAMGSLDRAAKAAGRHHCRML